MTARLFMCWAKAAATWANMILWCSCCDVDAGLPRVADATISDRFEPGDRVEVNGRPGVVGTKHKLTVAVLTLKDEEPDIDLEHVEEHVQDLFESAGRLAVTRNGAPDVNCCTTWLARGAARAAGLLAEAVDEIDVACCLRFDRAEVRPNRKVFSRIDDADDVRKMRELESAIKGAFMIFTSINVCGHNHGREILGCGREDTLPVFVAQRAKADTWMHEFGHLAGLDDVENCPLDAGRTGIMSTMFEKIRPSQADREGYVKDGSEGHRWFASTTSAMGEPRVRPVGMS